MLVSNSLLVNTHTLDRKQALFLRKEARVELVIRHQVEESKAHANGQEASDEEDDFPRLNRGAVDICSASDAIGDETTKDLRPTVEREPDTGPEALFALRVPLTREQCEAGSNSALKDTQENTDGHCTRKIADGSKASQRGPPADDVDCRVFAKRKSLQ